MTEGHSTGFFDVMLLIVGCAVAFFGFRLINQQYLFDRQMTWSMIIAIFLWLILLVLFILSSMNVDAGRRQLKEIRLLNAVIRDQVTEITILKEDLGKKDLKK
ncbi:hypothetical protein HZB01_01135 [Candidatus Woesearchaeota archaeon]|nr:hypothetical protein [Candidatus Woesearchaeota archaeon]